MRRLRGDEVSDESAVSLDDIKSFRQISRVTPGDPEYGVTTGVEFTTGTAWPRLLQRRWGRAGWLRATTGRASLFLAMTFQYGVAMGTLWRAYRATRLRSPVTDAQQPVLNYDSNRMTIEGHTDLAFSEDVAARFLAYGWNVRRIGDVNDTPRLAPVIESFGRTRDVPMLIIVESHIGYRAPHKRDTNATLSSADDRIVFPLPLTLISIF